MAVSVFDLFKIGIGPSSSHTVGPMRAAKMFCYRLHEHAIIDKTQRVSSEFYGSLGLTGRGHGTDKAVMLGLCGESPQSVDPDAIPQILNNIKTNQRLPLHLGASIEFIEKRDLKFIRRAALPFHPNGMKFIAYGVDNQELYSREYYSVGGGFVLNQEQSQQGKILQESTDLEFPFDSADDLLALCKLHKISIAELMLKNEQAWHGKDEIPILLNEIWHAMQQCVERGCRSKGVLPGGLKVPRRAPDLFHKLSSMPVATSNDALTVLDWVNLYALAVNEENAAGGRVVTAPTNGAAGIIPAVLHYYHRFYAGSNQQGIHSFLLTAAAIGMLYKKNASISGAEVGCQGEVGVACSMAAAGLTAAVGGSLEQIENAAEIGMEHNLGLTCDPIGGLVQIPCIERNAMGSVKAINAQRLAMQSDGKHHVSLDKVIKTMRDTGADMKTKYKETSRGGLAVNVIEC